MKELAVKALKKYLKRKIKISLATIVAFLLSSSFSMGDSLYIEKNSSGKIEFSKDDSIWGENPYKENSFKNNIYTNNIALESGRVGVVNWADNISFVNNGKIAITTNQSGWGIDNSKVMGSLINSGIISVMGNSAEGKDESYKTGIGNYGGDIGLLENNGMIKIVENGVFGWGIGINNQGTITDLTNNGIIDVFNGKGTYSSSGIINESKFFINNIINRGIIIAKGIGAEQNPPIAGIENHGKIESINNIGVIKTIKYSDGLSGGIAGTEGEISKIVNSGKILSQSKSYAKPIEVYGDEVINNGSVIAKGKYAYGIIEFNNLKPIVNNGVILSIKTEKEYSTNDTIGSSEKDSLNAINNGLLIGDSSKFIKNNGTNNGIMFDTNENGKYNIQGISNTTKDGIKIGDKIIVNANLKDEKRDGNSWTATGSENIALNGENKSNMIYNGITDTLKISGKNTLTNSIVNGHTSAIVYDVSGGELTLEKSIVNGGGKDNTNAIQGQAGEDNLTLKTDTIVNGNIDLGAGNDNLTLLGSVQLNDDISGGSGNDKLVIDGKNKLNLYNSINSFEDINLKNSADLTLYETAKIMGAENVRIEAGSQINLRVDSNLLESDGSYVTHALYNNSDKTLNIIGDMSKQDENGTIHESKNPDKFNKLSILNIVTNGIGNLTNKDGSVIKFGNTKIDTEHSKSTEKEYISNGGVWVKTDSILTHAEVVEEKSNDGKLDTKVIIKGQEDLFGIIETFPLKPVDPAKPIIRPTPIVPANPIIRPTPIVPANPIKTKLYVKLNDIYKGIYTSGDKNFGALNGIVVNHSFTDKDKGDYTIIGNQKMQMATLLEYLREIYEETPYSFSNEATKKSMELFHNVVRDGDFKAKEKSWLVYGGFTHENGDQEQSYYGKNYHGFDVGTTNTAVDIKITGAYGQLEYGNTESLSSGLILGGNNTRIKVESSKLEGTSAYIGTYLKKDIDAFRITTGLGYQYTEYDGKRNVVNQSYSENYKDRGLNLYLDGKYSYEIGEKLYLEPSLGLSYTHIDQAGIREEQDKALALNVDSKEFDILEGTIGVNLKKVIATEKGKHTVSGGVTYRNILDGDEANYLTANYGGDDFEILIPHKNRDQISVGIKYQAELENGVFYDIKGNYFLNTDSKENSNKNSDRGEWRTGFGIGYKL
ncbi:autotransporter outer membrane beta-barrel domain-containing protein [Fusobacterium sp.]|uniref:autotransporter outer membrane beta-barrel domain-containing protein n=1 Tax=Fusobacterium sp. TaxID=68766 RepID=UPI0025BF1BD8|nr:autotransporter outer membrane beta-barrel domain-containing protein [Fusobacterium sp.]